MAKVFSQKHSLTFVGNMGIYSVGTESVYQIGQSGKTECLHHVLTLRISVMCRAHASYREILSRELPATTL